MSQIDSWSLSPEIFGEIKKFEKPKPREISDWIFPSPEFQISELIPENSDIFSDPKLKSLKMLSDVVENTANMRVRAYRTCSENVIFNLIILLKGKSGRWYKVVTNHRDSQLWPLGSKDYQITVHGARWKRDLAELGNKFAAKLCLNPTTRGYEQDPVTGERIEGELPIGDRIATICLHLTNDIDLAMRIPLVAQFIIAPRDHLAKIDTFQDEYIVWNDMLISGPDDDFVPMDFRDFTLEDNDDEPSCCELTDLLEEYNCGCADAAAYEAHMEQLARELSEDPFL